MMSPTEGAGSPRPRIGSIGAAALRIPLLGKLAGANLLFVLAALAAVWTERAMHLAWNPVAVLAIALGASLIANLGLVHVALRPLADLQSTAERVSAGNLTARVPASVLADRDIARVGTTFNTVLDHLTEDRDRVRRLATQIIEAQDAERARVARELHDSTAQILTAVMLQLGVATHETDSPAVQERLGTLRELAAEALEEVRSLSHTMHPRVLDDLGLPAALEWLARQTRAQESFEIDVSTDAAAAAIPAPLASVLYRVAQEALRNAARHAEARHVTVTLRQAADSATLVLEDDGRGFDVRRAEERRPGMGLFSMRERVALVDGQFTVTSGPGQGTRIVATVPL